MGRSVAFTLDPTQDPVFDRRLGLSAPARGRWIVLTYRGDPVPRPLRPLLRLTRDDGRCETFVLPAPVQGAAVWLGYLPADCAAVDLAIDGRGFELERVGLRSEASLFGECLRKRPLRAIAAGYNRLRRHERRYRDILRGSCAVTPRGAFDAWARDRTRADRGPVPAGPTLQLILPARREEGERVAETIRSLQAQRFSAWRLHVAWDHAGADPIPADARIVEGRWPTAGCFGDLVGRAEVAALLTPGDRLDPDALAILVRTLSDAPASEMIYADACIGAGTPESARLKPDWSPDLALTTAYMGTPTLYAGALLESLQALPLDAQDTFPLRLALNATGAVSCARVSHVPRILSQGEVPDSDAGQRHAAVLQRYLDTHRLPARVEAHPRGFDLLWALPEPPPLASVIIPSRDRLDLIRVAADGVLNGTAYPAIELVIVDNGSVDPAVLAYYDGLKQDSRVRILSHPGPFNFSAMINAGVAAARGSVVVLLNNDVAVLREDWLEVLVRQACRPEIGAVGAKLLYADGTLQHAGVVVGLGGRAGHILRRRPAASPGVLGRKRVAHEVSAVTAACLAVERHKFDAVGGLDAETFAIDFNDVDVCLRLAAAGYRTIWTPRAVMAHLESTSRGPAIGAARLRFEQEAERFVARWGGTIRHDPYYHPALSLTTFGEDLE
ncbi:glycosyl transferase [Methylobacterium sp. Leaf113]|uniref:glycosyltransferase family 2 protein n=1 Tax=Methylobacterium sp. Leaf113 TaxID=1736259 RepID=UPI0006FF12DD|nr:glycosyltransferase [Methylobacterium sp. Leaf113]KQP75084.1 glycosyl transferase [Methylobacterium sp. Leaf113]